MRTNKQIKARQDKILADYVKGMKLDSIAKKYDIHPTYPIKIAQQRGFMSRMWGLPLKKDKSKKAA